MSIVEIEAAHTRRGKWRAICDKAVFQELANVNVAMLFATSQDLLCRNAVDGLRDEVGLGLIRIEGSGLRNQFRVAEHSEVASSIYIAASIATDRQGTGSLPTVSAALERARSPSM
jgi:hypothetical protein